MRIKAKPNDVAKMLDPQMMYHLTFFAEDGRVALIERIQSLCNEETGELERELELTDEEEQALRVGMIVAGTLARSLLLSANAAETWSHEVTDRALRAAYSLMEAKVRCDHAIGYDKETDSALVAVERLLEERNEKTD